MNKIKSVWGNVTGKVVAALLVLGIVCGAMFFSLHYALKGDVLLSSDEVLISTSSDDGNNKLDVKLSLNKSGYHLSDIKLDSKGDKLYVKFYASLSKNDKYVFDSQGYYNVKISFNKDVKTIVQEGADGDEATIITLNHKS